MSNLSIVVNDFSQPNEQLLELFREISFTGPENMKGEVTLNVEYKHAPEPLVVTMTYDLPQIKLDGVYSSSLAIYLLSHVDMVIDLNKEIPEALQKPEVVAYENWDKEEEPAFIYAHGFGSTSKDLHYQTAMRFVIGSLDEGKTVSAPLIVYTSSGKTYHCALEKVSDNAFELRHLQMEAGVDPDYDITEFANVRNLVYKALEEIQREDAQRNMLEAITQAQAQVQPA